MWFFFRWLLKLIQKVLILNSDFTRKKDSTPSINYDSLSYMKIVVLYLNHLKVWLLQSIKMRLLHHFTWSENTNAILKKKAFYEHFKRCELQKVIIPYWVAHKKICVSSLLNKCPNIKPFSYLGLNRLKMR